jgi:hypothetical protein
VTPLVTLRPSKVRRLYRASQAPRAS